MNNRFKIIAIILLLTALGQASIDLYLPSLPAIMHGLNTTSKLSQTSLTVFLLGLAVSPLIYGPVSDYLGRRKLLLVALACYIFLTILCAIAPSIYALIVLRLMQGLAAGAAVLARAIMRDCFEGSTLAKVASYQAIAWSTVPLLAPMIGGYIQHYLDWRMNFVFLVIFAALIWVFIYFALPETLEDKNRSKFQLRQMGRNYFKILTNKVFLGNVLCQALLYSTVITLVQIGPFLLQ